ncbi:MAG: hypothetical protein ACRBN8_05260 [Nannocystales bacterium]
MSTLLVLGGASGALVLRHTETRFSLLGVALVAWFYCGVHLALHFF